MVHPLAPELKVSEKSAGFTLIETLVALLIVAVAYAGVSTAVARFVDQRHILVERDTSHRIAWNRLMEQYLLSSGIAVDEPRFGDNKGRVEAAGVDWDWRLTEEDAAGDNLVRYQVDVFAVAGDTSTASGSLAAFFTR